MKHRADLARRRLWQAALAVPLVGCVVTPYGSYYRPVTAQPGAQDRRAWCQGRAGPTTGLDLDLGGGLQLGLSAGKAEAAGVPLRVLVSVPAHTALRFADAPEVRIAGRGAEPLRVTARRTVAVVATDWIDPGLLRPGSPGDAQEPHGLCTVRTQPMAVPVPRRITVQGLALVRDAGSTPLPPLTMERVNSRTQPYAYRSASEHAALLARVEDCRRDTPRLACQNIIDFAGPSHSGRLPGLRWDWRWWEAPHARPTVDGELRLAVLEPGRWRLDGSGLQLRDEDRGTDHALRLAPGSVSFSDRVDPMRGIGHTPGPTTLVLEATIPDGVADFELVLPLLRNDAPVALAPIRFERRNLDGGIEPFNC